MFDKLNSAEVRFRELEGRIADPAVVTDATAYTALMKEYRRLEPIAMAYRQYKMAKADLADAKELLEAADDQELKELAAEEQKTLTERIAALEQELKLPPCFTACIPCMPRPQAFVPRA